MKRLLIIVITYIIVWGYFQPLSAEGIDDSLFQAVKVGDVQMVKSLLEKGANVNARDENGNTPLHLAAKEGNIEIVKLLISHCAYVRIKNRWGKTPLDYAREIFEKKKYSEIIDLALIFVDRCEKKFKALIGAQLDTLWNSIKNGDAEKVEYILESWSKDFVDSVLKIPFDVGEKEMTLLHLAARLGYSKVAEVLISHGADVNAINKEGDTPLHFAVYFGNIEVAKVLISHGADLTLKNNYGLTPFRATIIAYKTALRHLYKKLNNNEITMDKFQKDSTEISKKYNELFVFLGFAEAAAFIDALETGNARAAEVVLSDSIFKIFNIRISGISFLHLLAEKSGDTATAKVLLSYGAEVNTKDVNGNTPLHLAVKEGHKDLVKFLISHGADVMLKIMRGKLRWIWL